jgi:hypothetical protein
VIDQEQAILQPAYMSHTRLSEDDRQSRFAQSEITSAKRRASTGGTPPNGSSSSSNFRAAISAPPSENEVPLAAEQLQGHSSPNNELGNCRVDALELPEVCQPPAEG